MLSLAVFFAAVSISTEVYSTPIQEIDLENILQYAQALENKPDRKNREIYGTLKSQEIEDLVQKASEDKVSNDAQIDKREYRDAEELLSELTSKHKNKYNKNDKVTFGHYYDKNALENVENNEFVDNDERYKNSRFNEQALEELLSKNVKKYNNLKPRLASLGKAGSVEQNNDRSDDDNADEYSKVYIILNPQAIEKSSNKKKLNMLLSRVLSLTSSPALPSETGRNKKYKDFRYKGFSVKSRLARRARHDSVDREVYASGDDDYKPKRVRSERGGGGGVGSAGGRTAIPYIRNRGDIYERDH